MRFKNGDRIVILGHHPMVDASRISDLNNCRGYIYSDYVGDSYLVKVDGFESHAALWSHQMELEEVFDSPLFQALK